ncbi:hypothetical protein, partial [Kribbella aluminosa]
MISTADHPDLGVPTPGDPCAPSAGYVVLPVPPDELVPPDDSYDLDDLYDVDGSCVPRYLSEEDL